MDTVYILINTQLQMSAGKVVAQAVHAALNLAADSLNYDNNPFVEWYLNNPNAVIILDGRNSTVLENLENYLLNSNLPARFFDYQDEGELFQKTALACGPFPKDHLMVKAVFGQFSLYKDKMMEADLAMTEDYNKHLLSKIDNLDKTFDTIRELAQAGVGKNRKTSQQIIKQIQKELQCTFNNLTGF